MSTETVGVYLNHFKNSKHSIDSSWSKSAELKMSCIIDLGFVTETKFGLNMMDHIKVKVKKVNWC